MKKTLHRRVKTLSGIVTVKEHVFSCLIHRKLIRPENIAPYRSSHCFDLMVRIGIMRYIQHKQVREIQEHLEALDIPERAVVWLCRIFLRYILAIHIVSAAAIKSLLSSGGGYVLMLDRTGQHGPMVMQMRDGWSGIHLLVCSVNSENDREIVPSPPLPPSSGRCSAFQLPA